MPPFFISAPRLTHFSLSLLLACIYNPQALIDYSLKSLFFLRIVWCTTTHSAILLIQVALLSQIKCFFFVFFFSVLFFLIFKKSKDWYNLWCLNCVHFCFAITSQDTIYFVWLPRFTNLMLVNVLVQAGGTNEASVFNHFMYGMEDNQASGCGINGAAWFSQSCRPPKQDLQEQLYQL